MPGQAGSGAGAPLGVVLLGLLLELDLRASVVVGRSSCPSFLLLELVFGASLVVGRSSGDGGADSSADRGTDCCANYSTDGGADSLGFWGLVR